MVKLKKIFSMKSKVIRIRSELLEILEEAAIKESMKRGVKLRPAELADEILELYFRDYVDLERETFRFEESIRDNK